MSAHYIVVGAGPAGVVAAEALRRLAPSARVTVVGNENEPPYSRMALPYLLAGQIEEGGTYLRQDDGHYRNLNVEVVRAHASALEPAQNTLRLENGESLRYDRLLIATGSKAFAPPIPGIDLDGVENCWTLDDARAIASRAKPGSRVTLIGAGFIGCIVLEALAARNVSLTVVETEDRMLARMMDETGGAILKHWCEEKGVRVLTGTKVTAVEKQANDLELSLNNGDRLSADLVVCATGVQPNISWLQGSGIATDLGVLVDHHLRSSDANVFAAGDVAQAPDFSTSKQVIHAIQPTAAEHGRVAAENMAGEGTPFAGSLSMNVLNTLGLVSSSYGMWEGVAGGERAVSADATRSKYLRLEFDGDVLVGALALGLTQHVGVLRGLMQTRVALGEWKDILLEHPHRVMEAYIACTQGRA